MKRLFFFLFALMLGSSLAWAEIVTISGTITVQGDALPPSDVELRVGRQGGTIKVIDMPTAVNTPTDYSVTVEVYGVVMFGLGGEFSLYGGEWSSADWFFVDDAGKEVNPMTLSRANETTMTVNLTIVPKGGSGGGGGETPEPEPDPTATLFGSVLSAPNTGISNATVTLTGADDFSKTTSTTQMEWDDAAGKMIHGYYRFKDVPSGEYTISYVKEGYTTTTQTVTVDASTSTTIELPTITMEGEAADYVFNGSIYYLNADNQTVYVEGAKITAYDGDGEDADVLGEPVYTNASGRWSMTLNCKANATVYFYAEHPNIVVKQRKAGYAQYTSGNTVSIYCSEYLPPLLGMETYKAKQMGTELKVQLTWTWPQDLTDNYKTETGGVYRISGIKINRQIKRLVPGSNPPQYSWVVDQVARVVPEENELPPTSFIDDGSEYELEADREFNYSMEIEYAYPFGNVLVPNDAALTVTLTAAPVVIDSVTLTLDVNDPAMGTVTGAGKYEKGDMVSIKAQANPGYRFVSWKEGDNVLASTPQYTVTLTENRTLTAFFEAKPVVLDSVILALEANNPEWGTVQGAGKYPKGEEVTIKAVPADGYGFKQWKSGNVILSSKPQYTFVLNTDSTVTAVFERQIVYRGMTNCAAKQTQSGASPSVRLSWEWPQALIADYITAEGVGIYEISQIVVRRLTKDSASADEVGVIRPASYTLPATSFVDNGSANYPLEAGKTYTYSLLVYYSQPAFKEVAVKNDAALTVTIAEDITPVEHFQLTLQVADEDMGTVQGAGEYEKDAMAQIIATPKTGYAFKAWVEGQDTLARTATHSVKMDRNRTITALFKDAAAVVPDSVVLSLVADENMGTVTGAGKYAKGASVTITATPKTGYEFESWQENGNPVSTKATYTINSLVADRTLTAVFVEILDSVTLTLAANDPDKGTVQGAGKFAKGKEVTIKAIPAEGYVFNAWRTEQGIFSREAEYTFTINVNLSLTAEFVDKLDSATLTLTVNDDKMGYVAGSGKYVKGTDVTVKATPRAHHGFEAWKSGQTVIATTPEYTFRLDSNTALTAVFYAYPDSVNLTLTVNDSKMGTVQGAGRYPKNGEATAKAIANPGYEFKAWKANGVNVSKSAEYTFTITEDLTLTAEFVSDGTPDSVTLTLNVADVKMGTVYGAGKYEVGQEVTIKAIANAGYEFRAWMAGEEIIATTAEYKFILNSDSTLAALFVEETSNEDREQAAWSVAVENQTIVLRSNAACQYDVYNMAGALVEHAKTKANEYRIAVNNSGLYIIRRISATGYSVKKVVVR